jgi:hypothetical protein
MNPLKSARIVAFKRLTLVILCAAASVCLLKSISVLSIAHSQDQERKRINGKVVRVKATPAERSSFSENGPLGRWSGTIMPDLRKNSSNAPVVVVGTRALMGNTQWRNLQLTHVTLVNYSSKTVLGVQIKWLVTTKLERSTEVAPAQYTGLFEAYLLPSETKEVESPLVKFSQAIKPLVKNGVLEGRFAVQIKIYQVEFEGGSTWNEDWGGPKPGEAGEPWHGPDEIEWS